MRPRPPLWSCGRRQQSFNAHGFFDHGPLANPLHVISQMPKRCEVDVRWARPANDRECIGVGRAETFAQQIRPRRQMRVQERKSLRDFRARDVSRELSVFRGGTARD
jgi:hypothetical protein